MTASGASGRAATAVLALVGALLWGLPESVPAQFSAAGGATAGSAAESASNGERVASYGKRNVYRAGPTVRVGSPIEGDFHAAGSRVVIDAQVRGDATLVGGSVEARKPIDGDLRAVAGKLVLDAAVGGDLLIAGSEIALERGARITRDALIAGRSVEIRAAVGGELSIYAQQVVIAAPIGGKVRIVAEDIELLEGATLGGELSYTSPNPVRRAPGVVIEGEITRRDAKPAQERPESGNDRRRSGWGLVGAVLWGIGLLAFGVTMHLAFPRTTANASRRCWSEPLACLGAGFALVIALPAGAAIAILTIVGIPLGGTVLALYPIFLLAGYLTGIRAVAIRMQDALGASEPEAGKQPPEVRHGMRSHPGLVWMAGTLAVLLVAGLVPFLGWLLSAWLTLTGMGGIALTLAKRQTAGSPTTGA